MSHKHDTDEIVNTGARINHRFTYKITWNGEYTGAGRPRCFVIVDRANTGEAPTEREVAVFPFSGGGYPRERLAIARATSYANRECAKMDAEIREHLRRM